MPTGLSRSWRYCGNLSMMIRPILVFLALFAIQTFISCCGDYDSGPLKIQSFEGWIWARQEDGLFTVYDGGEVQFEDLYIEMLPELVKKNELITRSATAFSGAYACSPPESDIRDSIVGIRVISDHVYSGLESGEDLSQFFGWKIYTHWPVNQDFSQIPLRGDYAHFYLVIVEPPTEGGVHQFLISVELEDGRILEVEIPQIEIATAD
jgi:hypothetical protein